MRLKILFIMLLCLPIVMAGICEDRLDNGSDCIMFTPSLICSDYTYDIIHSNGTLVVDDGNLTLLNNSVYYLNFTQYAGDYIIELCDGSTREFRVNETYDTKFQDEEDARMYIATSIGLLVTLAFFLYLFFYFKKEDDTGLLSPVRFIFLNLACIVVMVIIRMGVEILDDAGKTGLSDIMNTLWIILLGIYAFLFFVILFLYGVRFVLDIIDKTKYG